MKDRNIESNNPSVSVIVPVYNGMSTLPDCLDSIDRQDYTGEIEVIVVDDGSTDGSGDYAASRGYRLIRQENLGPGIARNSGAKAAKGDYLVFTDSDCILDNDFISELIKPLINSDIIGSQGWQYTNQRSLVARFIQYEYSERYDLQASSDYIDWIATYGACYRRDVFLQAGGFNETYSSEDCELSIRLAKQGYKMVYVPTARCQHRHYEKLHSFIRYKYKRAYWTIWLYKRHPNRLVKDRMTPFSRKAMMLFLAIALGAMIVALFWKPFWWTVIVALGITLMMTLPLTFRVIRQDFIVGLLTPFFLLTRTACYILGFIQGLIDYHRGIRRVKRSAAK